MEHDTSLVQLAFVLSAAFMGGMVVQSLRQPVMIGYILVGILLGPSVLGMVQNQQEIQLLAELGILLLLFIVGLEIDLKEFTPITKIAASVTLFQIVIGVGTMNLIGYMFDWGLSTSIILGFAVSLSSTAVALRLLEDMGVLHSQLGRMTVGVLVAQDIAVIPMMMAVGVLNGTEDLSPARIAMMVIGMGLMVAVIWALLHRPAWMRVPDFVRRLRPAMESQKALTGLAICFAAATLSGVLGLSSAYGAFVAGLVLGNTALGKGFEEQTKPIFDVLIMIFFLSVGLLIDLDYLIEHWAMVVTVLVVTMMIKTIVNVSILKFLGLSRRHAYIMGASLSQVGEFAFILASLALATNALSDENYKMVVAVIALSLMVTPLWLRVVRRVQAIGFTWRKLPDDEAVAD